MCYSIEPRDRIYVKGYGFLSFTKNIGAYSTKVAKNMRIVKYFLIVLKKPTTDAIKTASKRAIQKTAEPNGDLIGSKIAAEITSVSKSSKELHSQNNSDKANNEIEIPKERYISPEKREQIIDELRLI